MSATQFRNQLAIRYHHDHLDSQHHVMDVVHLLAYSMVLTVPRVGWSRKATMISVTVMPGLLM